MTVFAGLDPGIIRVGVAAITGRGKLLYTDVIKDDAKETGGRLDPVRLASIVRRTQKSINKAQLGTNVVFAIEEPFLWRGGNGAGNANSLKTYGVFSVLSNALQVRLDEGTIKQLIVVPPMKLKQFLSAKKKGAVIEAVKARWGFTDPCHDVVDAYALAQYAREHYKEYK